MIGSITYARATAIGAARPNLVTWTLWAAVPAVAFLAQLASGVGLPAVMTLSAAVGPAIVVAIAVTTRHSRVRLGTFDFACAGIAGCAVLVWGGLGKAPAAVLLAIAADGVALLPTLKKAWADPSSERIEFFVLVAIGAVITLLTVGSWAMQEWAFAAYQFVACAVLIGVVFVRRRRSLHWSAVVPRRL
nr:hypothetical protein [Gordonia araii]